MNTKSYNIEQNLSGKEPWYAVNLSMILWGLGQFYSGDLLKGILLILIQILFNSLFALLSALLLIVKNNREIIVAGLFSLFTSFLVFLYNLYDAYCCAKKVNTQNFEASRKRNKDAWLAVFLSRIQPGLGHIYIGKTWIGFILIFLLIIARMYFFPIGYLVVSFLVSPLVDYQVYTATPVRRENSKNLIVTVVILSVIVPTFIAIIGALIVRTSMVEVRWIPSGAMEPTLHGSVYQSEADKIILDKLSYKFSAPQRGDIIVFSPTDELRKEQYQDAFVKRVIGLPGERVELRDNKVYINNKPLQEDKYLSPTQRTAIDVCTSGQQPPYLSKLVTIPSHSYLVLGDNRGNSYDSRCWGVVPYQNIIGHAVIRFRLSNQFEIIEFERIDKSPLYP